jgi:hypothetical protein
MLVDYQIINILSKLYNTLLCKENDKNISNGVMLNAYPDSIGENLVIQ